MLKLYRAQVIIFWVISWSLRSLLVQNSDLWFCLLVTVLKPHPLKGRELNLIDRSSRPQWTSIGFKLVGIIQHSWNFSKCHFIFVLCACTNTYVPVSVFQINYCGQSLIKSNTLEPTKMFSTILLPVHFPHPRLCAHFPQDNDQNSWRVWPAGEALASSF